MIATAADSNLNHRLAALQSWPRLAHLGRGWYFGLLFFAALGLLLAPWAAVAEKSPNAACLECHSDKTLYKTNAAGQGI